MDKLNDIEVYVKRMQKSFMDKMFFIDKIFEPIENVIDFGCANGIMIHAMQYLFPEYNYIGYDISEDMIEKAKELVPGCEFHTEWDEIKTPFASSLLNISSTIHEVYSYGTEESVNEFWNRVFNSGFKYIAIRDMMLSDNIKLMSDEADVAKAKQLFPDKLKEYEKIWGPVNIRFNLIHYLLKYSYTENWEREVRENYLPITVETLLAKIPSDYEIVYKEHYVLPYVKQQIKKDCGIDLNDATHFKVLLKKKA
ncbi:MAG: methyltransferase domain-containing protein [Oscillospiraceae bacterium]|nr:methyltransferase domain-containing protein [Oscillospiraceae bacterium]